MEWVCGDMYPVQSRESPKFQGTTQNIGVGHTGPCPKYINIKKSIDA